MSWISYSSPSCLFTSIVVHFKGGKWMLFNFRSSKFYVALIPYFCCLKCIEKWILWLDCFIPYFLWFLSTSFSRSSFSEIEIRYPLAAPLAKWRLGRRYLELHVAHGVVGNDLQSQGSPTSVVYSAGLGVLAGWPKRIWRRWSAVDDAKSLRTCRRRSGALSRSVSRESKSTVKNSPRCGPALPALSSQLPVKTRLAKQVPHFPRGKELKAISIGMSGIVNTICCWS